MVKSYPQFEKALVIPNSNLKVNNISMEYVHTGFWFQSLCTARFAISNAVSDFAAPYCWVFKGIIMNNHSQNLPAREPAFQSLVFMEMED